MKQRLLEVPLQDEDGARARGWQLVSAAHARREPVAPQRRIHPVAVAATLVAVAAVLAVATPPGRAVVDRVREAVGIEHATPALYSLPAPGRLLVASDDGLWVINADGSRRRLGDYGQGSWSPFGRFVVATRADELAALEPDGDVRWTLARPDPHDAVWTGSRTDTRIAYVDRSGIRVVAGDGTDDRIVVPRAPGPVAWRPGSLRELAYVSVRGVRVVDVVTRRVVWSAGPRAAGPVRALEWSSDGRRLLVLHPTSLRVYDARGRLVGQDDPSDAMQDVDAAFRPGSHEVAVIRNGSNVFRLGNGRELFAGSGELRQLAWSPNGRWLLVAWPTADQWVFVRAGAPRRIRAAANVSSQLRTSTFPRIEGWCCTG